MKKIMGLKRNALLILIVIFSSMVLLGGCGGNNSDNNSENSEQYVINAVTYFDENSVWTNAFNIAKEVIEEKHGDQVRINRIGGPEIVSSFEMGAALKNGSVDMILLSASWLSSLAPETEIFARSKLTPWEEREKGVYDYYDQLAAEKLNAHYLGRVSGGMPNQVYTNFKVSSVEDFKNKLIRVTPLQREAMLTLGAESVSVSPAELYTAMDRSTVNGFCWPSLGVVELGMHEVTKYRIEPGFDQQDATLWINLDTWMNLPEDLRNSINELMPTIERMAYDKEWEEYEKEKELQQEKGIEIIELEPNEAKKFIDTITDGEWESICKRFPEDGPKLKEMMVKE